MTARRAISPLLTPLVLCALTGAPAAWGAEESLSFDSQRVLDLSGALRESARGRLATRAVDIDTASPQTGSVAAVLERPQVRPGDRDVLAVVAQKRGEARRIAAKRGAVSRKGPSLVVKSRSGEPFRFRDWNRPATQDTEADGESFIYAGMLKGTGYHKVDIHFAHDSPGVFLVHPRSGKVLFVHAEDDLASLSDDRSRLLVMNNGLNPPFGLLIATLRKEGPAVRLHCLAEGNRRLIPSFHGWHAGPAVGFDLVLVVRQESDQEAYEAFPVRFLYLNNEWRALASDADRLARATGLTCWQ